jgi:hypothetical protein
MRNKKSSVFWDTIRDARKLVSKGTQGSKRTRHQQKKMPLKMLQGVRKKMKKRIKKERNDNIQGGVIYNSFHCKDRNHFAIKRIKSEKVKEKVLRNDFGKTSRVLQTEKKIMEKRSERRERRKLQRKQKKMVQKGRRANQLRANTKTVNKSQKISTSKKIEHLKYKDGVLHIDPKLLN